MSIYTCWGRPVTITGNLGEHFPKDFEHPVVLLAVSIAEDDGSVQASFQFMHALSADGGYAEILQATTSAPPLNLRGAELMAAIQAAL